MDHDYYRTIAQRYYIFKPKPFTTRKSATFDNVVQEIHHQLLTDRFTEVEDSDQRQANEPHEEQILVNDSDTYGNFADGVTNANHAHIIELSGDEADDEDDKMRSTFITTSTPRASTAKKERAAHVLYGVDNTNMITKTQSSQKQLNYSQTQEHQLQNPIPQHLDCQSRRMLYKRYINPSKEWFDGIRSAESFTDTLQEVRRKWQMKNLHRLYNPERNAELEGNNRLLSKRPQTAMALVRVPGQETCCTKQPRKPRPKTAVPTVTFKKGSRISSMDSISEQPAM